MRNDFEAPQSRKTLDAMLRKVKRINHLRQPRVWIRDIREALGMNAKQFARRLGVRQPAIAAMEKSEQMGTVKIGTLRKAAEALECQLIYALVPKISLENIVHSRKCRIAEQELLAATPDFGRLPVLAQAISIDRAARRISTRRIWAESAEISPCVAAPDEVKKTLEVGYRGDAEIVDERSRDAECSRNLARGLRSPRAASPFRMDPNRRARGEDFMTRSRIGGRSRFGSARGGFGLSIVFIL